MLEEVPGMLSSQERSRQTRTRAWIPSQVSLALRPNVFSLKCTWTENGGEQRLVITFKGKTIGILVFGADLDFHPYPVGTEFPYFCSRGHFVQKS